MEKMPGSMDVIVRVSIVDKDARNDACALVWLPHERTFLRFGLVRVLRFTKTKELLDTMSYRCEVV